MTDIYDIHDISYEDIEEFLLANNKNSKDKNDAYDKALILLKDKKAIGHTTSIIEWMIAYNLFQSNINIPRYSVSEIDNMSRDDINKLAKLLTMKGNNLNNIKNILRFLHKLDELLSIVDPLEKYMIYDYKHNEVKILPPGGGAYMYRFSLPDFYYDKKISIEDIKKVMKFLKLEDSEFTGSGKNGNLLRKDRIDIINNFMRKYGGNVVHIDNSIVNNGSYGFDYTDL